MYLKYDSGHEHSDLHEDEVGCGIKVGQVGERQVVVKAIEEGRHHVVNQYH